MHDLQDRVGVRVKDMSFQAAVVCLVEKPAKKQRKLAQNDRGSTEYTPEVEILHAELRILDLYFAIQSGYFGKIRYRSVWFRLWGDECQKFHRMYL